MGEHKRNGLVRILTIVAVAIGIATGAGAIISTYIVGPVKETAAEAKTKAETNTEKIHDVEVDVAEIKKDTGRIPTIEEDLKRFMREYGVPTTEDLPAGEYPADE